MTELKQRKKEFRSLHPCIYIILHMNLKLFAHDSMIDFISSTADLKRMLMPYLLHTNLTKGEEFDGGVGLGGRGEEILRACA